MKIEIEVEIEDGRLVQEFSRFERNTEHCIHGVKLRWSCDECEELVEVMEPTDPNNSTPEGGE